MVEEEKEPEATLTEKQQEQTPQETVESLQVKLKQMEQELNQRTDNVRSLNLTLQQRATELKRRADIESRIDSLQDTIEVLATAVASRGEIEELDPTKRQDILAELKKKRADADAKAKQKELTEVQTEYTQKADALYNRAKAIFADDDDAIEKVEDLLTNGRLERAEARVAKAEQKKVPSKEGKMETEEQRIDKLAEEKLRKHLEERGLLETYTTTPSGSGIFSRKQIAEMSPEDYAKNRDAIQKAYSDNKIK